MTRQTSMSGALAVDAAIGVPQPRRITREEFDSFYEAHRSSLWAYIRRLCGDPATADDLFQKTFVRFLGATVPIDKAEHARGYLHRIATNIVFDHFRALRAEEEWKPEPGSRGESAAILRADMERMFRLLTPQERALLWLAHVEGYDHAELAKIAGVARGSVRVLLFRARRKLASILEQHGLSPEVPR